MKYELQTGVDFEQLAQQWRALEARAVNPFFLSWYWIGTWLQVMQPAVVLLRGVQNDSVHLLALFVQHKTRIKGFIPVTRLMLHRTGNEQQDQIWIEYNGLLHSQDVTTEQLADAIRFLQQSLPWDELVIGISETRQLEGIIDAGLSRVDAWEAPGYAIDLERVRQQGGDYLGSLSKNTRYQLGRARRALEAMGAVSYTRATTQEQALQWLEQAAVWHRQRWGDKPGQSGFANPAFCRFHTELIKAGFADGVVELCQFALDGKPLAIQYNFVYRKQVYFYLSGVDYADADDSKLKIGLLMHLYAIEFHLKQGSLIYDFMAGDARYKRSLASPAATQYLARLRKPRLRYRLEDWGRQQLQRLRQLRTNLEVEQRAAKTEVQQPLLMFRPMLWIAGWLLLLLGVFQAPVASLMTVWYESKTFNHGFLIFPLIGWFIWRTRHRVAVVQPHVSWLGAILGMVSALVELLGMAANVNILQHMALAGMLLFGAITFIGWRAAWALWFPLSLLAFVPPLGEELVPLFQQLTADLAVWMLQLTGVPVFRDGLYITIPAGHFEVAEACSGIRFFVACVFLGYLFGCINFRSIPKRIGFVMFGIALPIVANGIRVYGTILVGHFIDMKYAGGADHLVYGWFFFLLVIGVLVLVGTRFSDIRHSDEQIERPVVNPAWHHHVWPKAFVLASLPAIIAFAAHLYVANSDDTVRFTIEADGLPGTASQQAEKYLLPSLHNPSGSLSRTFVMNGKLVTLFVGWYEHNHPDAELISWYSRLYDINQWAAVSNSSMILPLPGQHANAGVERLVSPRGQRRALIYWYDVPGLRSHSKIAVKLQQALNRLSGRSSGGALVALSIPVTRETDAELLSLLENNGILAPISSTIVFK